MYKPEFEDCANKGYNGEELLFDTIKEVFGDSIDKIENNVEKGYDYYKVNKGNGPDIRLWLKGVKNPLEFEAKNINHETHLSTRWFNKDHELPFNFNNYGIKIIVSTAKINIKTRKDLKEKGCEVWALSEQINDSNRDKIKLELINKCKSLVCRIKNYLNRFTTLFSMSHNNIDRRTVSRVITYNYNIILNRIYRMIHKYSKLIDKIDRLNEKGAFWGKNDIDRYDPPPDLIYSIYHRLDLLNTRTDATKTVNGKMIWA